MRRDQSSSNIIKSRRPPTVTLPTWILSLLCLLVIGFIYIYTMIGKHSDNLRKYRENQSTTQNGLKNGMEQKSTLTDDMLLFQRFRRIIVSYVAYVPLQGQDESHTQCLSNLDFFLDYGVVKDSRVKYVFNMIGQTKTPKKLMDLKRDQSSIELINGKKYSVDLYAHGDVIKRYQKKADLFIFVNCGCRGPYYPLSSSHTLPIESSISWIRIFAEKLVDGVKVVGPTISCEVSRHVQSYAMAMDRDAAKIAKDFWTVSNSFFSSGPSKGEIIDKSEVGLGKAFLKKGYNIASLDSRHIGRDFREENSICDPEYEKISNSIYANPAACRFDEANNITSTDTPGCLGFEPCELLFVKNGGDILRIQALSSHTIANLQKEDSSLKINDNPHMCLQAIYPQKPYHHTKGFISNILHQDKIVIQQTTEITKFSPKNIVITEITLKDSTWIIERIRNYGSILFPSGTLLFLVPRCLSAYDKIQNEIIDHPINIFSNVYIVLLKIPSNLYYQYTKYTQKLCYEYQKSFVSDIYQLSYHNISESCVHTRPIHYHLIDSLFEYTLEHCKNCKRFVVLSNDEFKSESPNIISILNNQNLESMESIISKNANHEITAYSIPIQHIIINSEKLLSYYLKYHTVLPRRPMVHDYSKLISPYTSQLL